MPFDKKSDDLARHAAAAKSLLEELNSDDTDFAHDVVEGETDLLEAIDAALSEMDDCEVIISGCKEVGDKIKARSDKASNRKDRLRGLIEQSLVIAGLDTAKRPTATLTVRKVKPKAFVSDEALIPAEYWRQPDPVLDKPKINKLDAPIPGVTMSNGGTSLQIRRV